MSIKRSIHRSQRVSENIKLALETLRDKALEYEQALAIREQLHRRMALLEHLADGSSAASLLHQLAAQALTIKQRPKAFLPQWLEPSCSSVCLDAMPVSLHGYNDAVLQRLARLEIGDHVQVYKDYLHKAHPLAISVNCHGTASPVYQQLHNITQQYTIFNILRSMVATPSTLPITRANFLTGELDSVPEGWYDRVALLLPLHKEFAQLVAAAVAVTEATERNAVAHFLQQTVPRLADQHFAARLLHLHELFEEYGRRLCSPFLTNLQVMGHVTMSALQMPHFPSHKLCLAYVSCWPYPLAGIAIFKGYLRRADVEALLQPGGPKPLSLPSTDSSGPSSAARSSGDLMASMTQK